VSYGRGVRFAALIGLVTLLWFAPPAGAHGYSGQHGHADVAQLAYARSSGRMATTRSGWKADRAVAIARIVWHHPCVDRMRLEWISRERFAAMVPESPDGLATVDRDRCVVLITDDVSASWDDLCYWVIHEGGHLARFRDPTNAADPDHADDLRSIMFGVDIRGFTISEPGSAPITVPRSHWRCRHRGAPFLRAHGR